MKFKHKYLNPMIIFLCVFLFGLFIHGVSSNATNWIYTYLNHLFPNVFPLYNRIYDIQAYERIEQIKGTVSIFVSLCLVNFIALKIDNKKYEHIIRLTDGEYLIKDGIKLYFKEFLLTDAIVSIIIPAILVVPAYFLSEEILDYFGLIFWNWLGYNMKSIFKLFPAIMLSAAFSFVGRIMVIPHCVKAWRASWMTDI